VKPYLTPEAVAYAALLADSFHRQTGQFLPNDPEQLWHHPQPLVSHGTETDPIFRYANQAALDLWQMDWQAFTKLPSRHSAEADPNIQTDRASLLQAAFANGYVANYQGIRISAKGNRFAISETLLWTVTDSTGKTHGQAALIGKIKPLKFS
jgi:MEKHLA domain